jgi:hypothetical protein
LARRVSRPLAASLLALLVLLALIGCGRAIDRPARGAAPGVEAAQPTPAIPPTLTASETLVFRALPSPSADASVGPSPSPAGSPSPAAMPPIVRTIAPPADGTLPPGAPVTLSAVLVGRGADLAAAQLFLNGGEIGGEIDRRNPREWTIRATQALGPGTYTARVLVRDATGGAGGFTWRFTIGAPAPPPGQPTEEEPPE